jgi:hypothetical protein
MRRSNFVDRLSGHGLGVSLKVLLPERPMKGPSIERSSGNSLRTRLAAAMQL